MFIASDRIEYKRDYDHTRRYKFCPDPDWWKQGEEYSYIEESESPLEKEFKTLALAWKNEIGAESSLSKITSNMNYLRIIALGKDALPFIYQELQREPGPWFVALRAITGELEIGKGYAGNS
jgi:hypothetical protein